MVEFKHEVIKDLHKKSEEVMQKAHKKPTIQENKDLIQAAVEFKPVLEALQDIIDHPQIKESEIGNITNGLKLITLGHPRNIADNINSLSQEINKRIENLKKELDSR